MHPVREVSVWRTEGTVMEHHIESSVYDPTFVRPQYHEEARVHVHVQYKNRIKKADW